MAWTTPESFAQWWVPAPALCRVAAMDLRPGGALVTEIDEGAGFGPHLSACYLAIEPERQLVFTNALTGDWRPAETPFITAVITLADHPDGTTYHADVMHKSDADRAMHEQLGFTMAGARWRRSSPALSSGRYSNKKERRPLERSPIEFWQQ